MEKVIMFYRICLLFAGFTAIFLSLPLSVSAQIELERISVTERSDQLGYVVRFHFSGRVDGYQFSQPARHVVQITVQPETINTDQTLMPPDGVIQSIDFHPMDESYGFLFTIHEQYSLRANVYWDINPNHLLLNLERVEASELDDIVQQFSPLIETADVEEVVPVVTDVREPARVQEVKTEREPQTKLSDVLSKRSRSTLDRISPGDPLELYLRAVAPHPGYDSQSSWLLRPVNIHRQKNETGLGPHPWMNHTHLSSSDDTEGPFHYRIYTAEFYRSNNSDLPMGQNDGVLWQGRGLNYLFTAGAGVQYGLFTAVFRPQFAFSENLDFPLEGRDPSYIPDYDISLHPRYSGSEFQDFLLYADYPIRFGEEKFSTFDLGDSFIQAEYNGFAGGLSNERLWTGPAVHNPLIFSNHAPGFFHGFIGTVEPYRTKIGSFEGRWIWGSLRSSKFYGDVANNGDAAIINDPRYITALSVNYSPSVLPGLSVGFTRAAVSYASDGIDFSGLFRVFRSSLPPPDEETAVEDYFFNKSSFFARWVFPSANFEAYAEWGRNDDSRPFRDFIAEPELNRGFVLGFLKNFRIGSMHNLLLNTEVTNLENSSVTATKRDFNIWYTNPVIGQGFTHKGQVLGAGIGPGSSTQFMGLQYYNRWGRAGVSGRRIAHNIDRLFKHEDYLRDNFARFPEFFFLAGRHEIEMRYTLDLLIFLPYGLEFVTAYRIGKTENRYYMRGVDINNYQFSFTLRFTPPGNIRHGFRMM